MNVAPIVITEGTLEREATELTGYEAIVWADDPSVVAGRDPVIIAPAKPGLDPWTNRVAKALNGADIRVIDLGYWVSLLDPDNGQRLALIEGALPYADWARKMASGERAGTGPSTTVEAPAKPALADEPDILSAAVTEVARLGVHGEERVVRLIYLTATSRLLDRPANVVIKGPSSGGKSYITERALSLFPREATVLLSSMSEKALVYDVQDSLAHRMVVMYEAAGMASDMASYFIRSLISEGCIDYKTVVKVNGKMQTVTIHRDGPTGFITTTTAVHLHPENETRMVSVLVSDDAGQTKAVMRRMARGLKDPTPGTDFIELQQWLAWQAMKHRDERLEVPLVRVPFAVGLADLIPPVAVRLRRDFRTLLTLIEAHALLHRATREVSPEGSVVATVEEDYAAVEAFFSDLVADGVERAVPLTVRETVEAVRRLTSTGTPTTVTSVAEHLKVDKSSASRRLSAASDAGYIENDETRPGRAAKWRLGDVPMPADLRVLPTPEELLQCCSGAGGDEEADLDHEVAPPPPALKKPRAIGYSQVGNGGEASIPPVNTATVQHPERSTVESIAARLDAKMGEPDG